MLMKFKEQEFNIWKKDNRYFMSKDDLAQAIDYCDKATFSYFLEKNNYLLSPEFSVLMTVDNLEGGVIKKREKRFFTEQGVYEVSLLANTQKAKEFRKFARHLITSFRKGEIQVTPNIAVARFDILDRKLDEMVEVIKGVETIVTESEEAEKSFREAIERVDDKIREISIIKDDVKTLIKLYEQTRQVVNEHDNLIKKLMKGK